MLLQGSMQCTTIPLLEIYILNINIDWRGSGGNIFKEQYFIPPQGWWNPFFGLRIYILWSENLPCINYGSVNSCLSCKTKTFTRSNKCSSHSGKGKRSKSFDTKNELFIYYVITECESLHKLHHYSYFIATYLLTLVIKWNKFPVMINVSA